MQSNPPMAQQMSQSTAGFSRHARRTFREKIGSAMRSTLHGANL